jgi:acyl-coenzyme A synthetase/AMP-(fatty) acid ligase
LIEILGREDSQVKVNGFHIELGEIRKVLADHPSVVLAALAVHNNTLGAYLVLKRGAADTNAESDDVSKPNESDTNGIFNELKNRCKLKLADYMVPKHLMAIAEIPLSSNGKVQRELLPSPLDAEAQG